MLQSGVRIQALALLETTWQSAQGPVRPPPPARAQLGEGPLGSVMASPSPYLGPNHSAPCGSAPGEGSRVWGPTSPAGVRSEAGPTVTPSHRKVARAACAPPHRRAPWVPWALLAFLGLRAAGEDEPCCSSTAPWKE